MAAAARSCRGGAPAALMASCGVACGCCSAALSRGGVRVRGSGGRDCALTDTNVAFKPLVVGASARRSSATPVPTAESATSSFEVRSTRTLPSMRRCGRCVRPTGAAICRGSSHARRAYGGLWQGLFGPLSYAGNPVHGFGSTGEGNPLAALSPSNDLGPLLSGSWARSATLLMDQRPPRPLEPPTEEAR